MVIQVIRIALREYHVNVWPGKKKKFCCHIALCKNITLGQKQIKSCVLKLSSRDKQMEEKHNLCFIKSDLI